MSSPPVISTGQVGNKVVGVVERGDDTSSQPAIGDDSMSLKAEHPAMWAITFDQLVKVKEETIKIFGSQRYVNATMRDVNDLIITPSCIASGKSYALQQNPFGLRLDAFITHSWDEPFVEFVESIEDVYQTTLEKPNLWICAFALVQGSEELIAEQLGTSQQRETSEPSLADTPFVRALQLASSFVVVRNPRVDLYSRIWCVCELMYAREFGLVPAKTSITGANAFMDVQSTCLNARATSPKDQELILSVLLQRHNREEIDSFVNQFRSFRSSVSSTSPAVGRGEQGSKLSERRRFRASVEICGAIVVAIAVVVILAVFLPKGTDNSAQEALGSPQTSESPTAAHETTSNPTIRQSVTDSPAPTLSPTNAELVDQSTGLPCITSREELLEAVTAYFEGSDLDPLTIYGDPIGTWCLRGIEDFSHVFSPCDWCSSHWNDKAVFFNEDLSGWNLSTATEVTQMIAFAESFNQSLDMWDVGRVTDFGEMFRNARGFNGNLSAWDVSNALTFRAMFSRALSFNSDISGWQVSKARGMGGMFSGAQAFNIDLSGWDISGVEPGYLTGFSRHVFGGLFLPTRSLCLGCITSKDCFRRLRFRHKHVLGYRLPDNERSSIEHHPERAVLFSLRRLREFPRL